MEILKNIEVPTGNILIVNGEYGELECVSLGDYRRVNPRTNIKINDTDLSPLLEEWILTVSTQYGCNTGCVFCDVSEVGGGRNVSNNDLVSQIDTLLSLHPNVTHSDRMYIHYARMGEPTWNKNIINVTRNLPYRFTGYNIHPIVSTMMPSANKHLEDFIHDWMFIKNINMNGNAGLQLSINSTNESERAYIFNNKACTLQEISDIMQDVMIPVGRKITLNFAVLDYEIDTDILLKYFDPKYYLVKLTPMYKTTACKVNGIQICEKYTAVSTYATIKQRIQNVGYDVITSISSEHADVHKITCGHAILANK